MEKRRNMKGSTGQRLLILVCLVISAVSVLYLLQPRQSKSENPLPIPNYTLPQVEAKSTPQEVSVPSADGKFTIYMKEEKGKDNLTYRFSVTGDSGKKEIFSRTLAVGDTMSIPANTFSPDNKYVFLKETASTGTNYFVLAASGEEIKKGVQSLEFAAPFAAKYPNFKISEVTGWGGLHLIVFNVEKLDGSIGPSFWFEVPSGGFTQLSTKFN